MTPGTQANASGRVTPAGLLAALRASAAGDVDGASEGSLSGAPQVAELSQARADAVLAAWTGARLHAGQVGLLAASDTDLALLVGDWCFANALQSLAQVGDLVAIGLLASAIGDCAVLLTQRPADPGALAGVWQATSDELAGR